MHSFYTIATALFAGIATASPLIVGILNRRADNCGTPLTTDMKSLTLKKGTQYSSVAARSVCIDIPSDCLYF
jgi:hypothetical protein